MKCDTIRIKNQNDPRAHEMNVEEANPTVQNRSARDQEPIQHRVFFFNCDRFYVSYRVI